MVVQQIGMLFLLIGIGWIIQRKKLLESEFSKGLSTFILYVSLPALIIKSMNYKFDPELMKNSMILLVSGILFYPIAYGVSKLVAKILNTKEPQLGVFEFMMIFGNVGFMGYPVVKILFGDLGVFYAAMFNFSFNLYIWTLGIYLIRKGEGHKLSLKSLVNPGTVSLAIGFLLFLTSIQVPVVIAKVLESVGNTTTPLSMIVIGMLLGSGKDGNWIKSSRLWLASITRLLAIPIMSWGILYFMPFPQIVKTIIVILTGMPTAAMCAIFANKYESDYQLASRGVMMTTLLSMITIPILIYIQS